jgi:hypothetical protein
MALPTAETTRIYWTLWEVDYRSLLHQCNPTITLPLQKFFDGSAVRAFRLGLL